MLTITVLVILNHWKELCGLNHSILYRLAQSFLFSSLKTINLNVFPHLKRSNLKSSYKIGDTTCWPRSVLSGFLFTSLHLTSLNSHPALSAVVTVPPSGECCHGWVMLVLCLCGFKRQPFLKYRVRQNYMGYMMPKSYLTSYQSLTYWEELAFGPEPGLWKWPVELGRYKKRKKKPPTQNQIKTKKTQINQNKKRGVRMQ